MYIIRVMYYKSTIILIHPKKLTNQENKPFLNIKFGQSPIEIKYTSFLVPRNGFFRILGGFFGIQNL